MKTVILSLVLTLSTYAEITKSTRSVDYKTVVTTYHRNGKLILRSCTDEKDSKLGLFNFYYNGQELAEINNYDVPSKIKVKSGNKVDIEFSESAVLITKEGKILDKFIFKNNRYEPVSQKELKKLIEEQRKITKEAEDLIKNIEEKPKD